MKRVIQFSKFFLPMVVLSVVVIVFGIAGLFIKGINLGIDFQAGLIEQVRIAPAAFSLSYEGSQSVSVSLSRTGIDLVVTGLGGDNRTYSFPFDRYPSAGLFTEAVAEVPGVTVNSMASASVPMDSVFVDSSKLTRLSATPYLFHYVSMSMEQISVDEVRARVKAWRREGLSVGLVPTMLLVTVCVFFFVHLLPGDPAQLAAGPEADEETVQMVRERLGLDRPLDMLRTVVNVTGDATVASIVDSNNKTE